MSNFVDSLNLIVVTVGIVYLVYLLLKLGFICYYVINVFIYGRWRPIDLYTRYGEYVIITGATDGIGLEFAKQFAQRGHSLIIIGRNESKLQNVKAYIEPLLFDGRKVVTILADLNTSDPFIYHHISAQLKDYKDKIGILINNAGVGTGKPDEYLNISEDEVLINIKVNIIAVLLMTRAVVPYMMKNSRGLIINVGSMASYRPVPYGAVYSASKKFVEYFGASIRYEYRKYNIDVQTLYPSFVATKMAKWSTLGKPNALITPTTYEYVRSAMATIGRSDETSGYWSHAIFGEASLLLPDCVYNVVAEHTKDAITVKC